MIQSDTEQSASGLRSPAAECVARTKSVRFEQLMSFRPQIGIGKEPPLRDLIHKYYSAHFSDPVRVDDLTKQYIEKLWQANL